MSIEFLEVTPKIPSPKCSIINDIQSVIEGNDEFQNVTLLVGPRDSREEIKANKMMLMARSPVFAVMFQSEMVEKATSTVEITDISTNEFKILLKFIYTDDKPDLNDLKTIEDVIIDADKYQIIRLKNLCENQLLTNYLSIENAGHLLAFADQYDLKFKNYVIERF
ncbi:TD and POZ domain-containing protein 3-like [Halichondria panicea]|uniref:TD and POZ domain-containing protein 3-like n=1 Tax=Halichondria panicea TaxID=6063 RepID=UPI00312B449D